MYYCNCVNCWEAAGITPPKNDQTKAGYYLFRQVAAKQGDCVHCGYAALWSDTHPDGAFGAKKYNKKYKEPKCHSSKS